MEVYTIGFTKKTAEEFFSRLADAGIRRLIDVRLNNVSQLAGFTRRSDLAYFLRAILGAEYVHEPRLAPTQDLLGAYRAGKIDWAEYERRFLALMAERHIDSELAPSFFEGPSALLCSEATAEQCHRRLVLEYLTECWASRQELTTTHL